MYNRAFFRSKLGRAALLSIAATVAMNLAVLHRAGDAGSASAPAASEGDALA